MKTIGSGSLEWPMTRPAREKCTSLGAMARGHASGLLCSDNNALLNAPSWHTQTSYAYDHLLRPEKLLISCVVTYDILHYSNYETTVSQTSFHDASTCQIQTIVDINMFN